jgi:hypothetical protein
MKRVALGGTSIQDNFALNFFGVNNASAFSQRISEQFLDTHTSRAIARQITCVRELLQPSTAIWAEGQFRRSLLRIRLPH